jgi:hypothetical protein
MEHTAIDYRLPPQGIDFKALERTVVLQALRIARGNQTRAATLLGMTRDQIRYRMAKFGMTTRDALVTDDGASVMLTDTYEDSHGARFAGNGGGTGDPLVGRPDGAQPEELSHI